MQQKVARGYRAIAECDDTAYVFDARLEAARLALEIRNTLRERWLWFPDEEEEA